MGFSNLAVTAATLPAIISDISGNSNNGATLAKWALFISIINATVALWNFALTRIRLPKVRLIQTTFTTKAQDLPVPSNCEGKGELVVDILNSGAAIWDMEVLVEIYFPVPLDREKKYPEGVWMTLQLEPVGEQLNPLNAGQSQEFLLTQDEFKRRPLRDFATQLEMFRAVLPKIPKRNISLCVFCMKRRKLLKRVRSRNFYFQLNALLGSQMKVKAPLWNILYCKIFELSYGEKAQKLRRQIEKRWPGEFDRFVHRLKELTSARRGGN